MWRGSKPGYPKLVSPPRKAFLIRAAVWGGGGVWLVVVFLVLGGGGGGRDHKGGVFPDLDPIQPILHHTPDGWGKCFTAIKDIISMASVPRWYWGLIHAVITNIK